MKAHYLGDEDIITSAVCFAESAYNAVYPPNEAKQYLTHSFEVAYWVKELRPYDKEAIAIALLNEVVNHCGIQYGTLVSIFGVKVAAGISELSRPKGRNFGLQYVPEHIQDIRDAKAFVRNFQKGNYE